MGVYVFVDCVDFRFVGCDEGYIVGIDLGVVQLVVDVQVQVFVCVGFCQLLVECGGYEVVVYCEYCFFVGQCVCCGEDGDVVGLVVIVGDGFDCDWVMVVGEMLVDCVVVIVEYDDYVFQVCCGEFVECVVDQWLFCYWVEWFIGCGGVQMVVFFGGEDDCCLNLGCLDYFMWF